MLLAAAHSMGAITAVKSGPVMQLNAARRMRWCQLLQVSMRLRCTCESSGVVMKERGAPGARLSSLQVQTGCMYEFIAG